MGRCLEKPMQTDSYKCQSSQCMSVDVQDSFSKDFYEEYCRGAYIFNPAITG